jgi:hypothetical protein
MFLGVQTLVWLGFKTKVWIPLPTLHHDQFLVHIDN